MTADVQEFRLHRDGERDIVFSGALLGEGQILGGQRREGDADWWYERGTVVSIYLTTSARFVVHVNRWTEWGESERDSVTVVDTGEQLLEALKEGNGGKFGAASRDAWNAACAKHEPLRPLEMERLS